MNSIIRDFVGINLDSMAATAVNFNDEKGFVEKKDTGFFDISLDLNDSNLAPTDLAALSHKLLRYCDKIDSLNLVLSENYNVDDSSIMSHIMPVVHGLKNRNASLEIDFFDTQVTESILAIMIADVFSSAQSSPRSSIKLDFSGVALSNEIILNLITALNSTVMSVHLILANCEHFYAAVNSLQAINRRYAPRILVRGIVAHDMSDDDAMQLAHNETAQPAPVVASGPTTMTPRLFVNQASTALAAMIFAGRTQMEQSPSAVDYASTSVPSTSYQQQFHRFFGGKLLSDKDGDQVVPEWPPNNLDCSI